ncbi:MAG: CoA transferase [Gammaproteobacteria bacterium]|nr:CoA transferase [Gammaproteobacteria bacterium]
MNPLLSGLRVLDLTRLLPGPFCTLYLAQMGATVIKIEAPGGGDYARALSPELFALINRGKQSLALDLRKPAGAGVLRRLAHDADVLIESFRPGVMDKLGCGYAALRGENPRLVYAALTGYGQTGPWKDRAGHDLNYCGYAGVLDQTGTAAGPPAQCGFQIADLAGGALTCAIGILAAVIGARASGHGCLVDAAMLDGTLALQAVTLAHSTAFGVDPQRGHDLLTGGLPSYAVYRCADGKYLALGALEPKFWANFCRAAGRPELARKTPQPGPAGEPLRAELAALVAGKTRDQWETLLADADACASAVLTPVEALHGDQIHARGLVQEIAGKPAFGLPLRFEHAATAATAPAAKLGADTDAVLAAAGYSAEQRRRLRDEGVIT